MASFVASYLSRYELDPDELHDVAIKAQPMWALYTFEKAKGSESTTVRFKLRGPRGFGRNLTKAQTISNINPNSDRHRFVIGYGQMEGSILFNLAELEKAESDPEWGADFLETEMESGAAGFAQDIIYQMESPAGGAVSSTTVTFHSAASSPRPVYSLNFSGNPEDLGRLQEGDLVDVSTAAGTASTDTPLANPGVIIDIDRDNGYIQVAATSDPATAANPGGWDDTGATSYYVFRHGDMHAAAPENTVIPFDSYNPETRATDTLFSVDRGADAALSGQRLLTTDAGAKSTLARRIKALDAKTMNRLGMDKAIAGKRRVCTMNPEDWAVFEDQQNSRVMREVEKKAVDGYTAIQIMTANGYVDVVAEPARAKGKARLLSPSQLKFIGITGRLVNFVKYGMGQGMLVAKPGSNDFEARPFMIGAHTVGNPAAHGYIFTT